MPLPIPTSVAASANWAKEIIDACHESIERRRQRGAAFRNLYLTGSEEGTPQTYKKTYTYIQTLAALLYSPAELRFAIAPTDRGGPRERAMGRSAASVMLDHIRASSVDTTVEDCVEWALVKGKTFLQLEWDRGGLTAHMVQPETIGVLRDDLTKLDQQDAFVHSTWMTPERFASFVYNHPDRTDLIRRAKNFISTNDDRPDTADNSRQVIIGGQLYPYRASTTPSTGARGLVNWLRAPQPDLAANVLTELIRLDELWVWDRNRDDWTTFQLVGNVVIEPHQQFRNRFSEGHPVIAGQRRGRRYGRGEGRNDNNPLAGHHPFVEICPNPLPDYFWGWSELYNVASLQEAINDRVFGINRLLRRQEDPSWLIAGLSDPKRAVSTLKKRGGWHAEGPAPGIKVEKMTPDLPAGLWESLHELEQMFDQMGGFPPVMQGQGEQGVRAQGHAETLVRMASPRFRDRALGVERQVEEVGGLALDLLRAHVGEEQVYWVKQSQVGPFKNDVLDELIFEPPAPGLLPLPYLLAQVGDRYRVKVDSHSSSPIFSQDSRQLALLLSQRGAISPEDLIRLLHPPGEEELVADLETRETQKAEFIAQHPEVLLKGKGGGRKAA